MKNNGLPEIRFSGFFGVWEEKKLGEVSDKIIEKNKDNLYLETFTNSAEHGIINQRDFFSKDISNEKNLNGYYIVRPDYFVYNPRISSFAPVGPIKRNNLRRIGVMSPLYHVFSVHDIDETYLEIYFSSNLWHNFMKLNGDSGARSDRFAIRDSVFREMPIPFPSLDEQIRIGNFFKQLDDKINLNQRELQLLKQTKKGFLQKMFPKEGESVPEIRFDGFSGDWEECKLGTIKDVRDGTHNSPKYYLEGYPLITSKNLTETGLDYSNVSLISEKDFSCINKRSKVDIGDIIFGMIGTIGNAVMVDRDDFAIKNVALIKNTGSVINKFLIVHLKSPIFEKYICDENVGNTQKFLGLNKIRDYLFLVPKIQEQEKIGKFFKKLDQIILLHERELQNLKQTKKAFLQKIFV